MTLRAITIRQPWAWLIVHGFKDVENRSWGTAHRGPLAIHAAATPPAAEDVEWAESILGRALPTELECGGIIGTVELVGIVTASPSPWFTGPLGWQLANPVAFAPENQIEIKGRLGLWTAEIPNRF